VKIEASLAKLEDITARLEKTDLPLDEAIALFEEGLSLASAIKRTLDEARLRIDQVIENARGSFEIEPLDVE
jgi:exodeoxyribonuclease VII small subunit